MAACRTRAMAAAARWPTGASSKCRAATAMSGRLAAFDVRTMQEKWNFQQRPEWLTGVLTTDGGISIVGDLDRTVHAFDTATGKELWKSRLGTSVQGFPVAFAVDGKQYIAVPTGLGGGSPRNVPRTIEPDIKHPQTATRSTSSACPKGRNHAHRLCCSCRGCNACRRTCKRANGCDEIRTGSVLAETAAGQLDPWRARRTCASMHRIMS